MKMFNICNEGINELTVDCDRFSIYKDDYMWTYLWKMGAVEWTDDVGYIAIRVPGATRGYIQINKDYVITNVKFYPDVCFQKIKCYSKDIRAYIRSKYIGMKFDCKGVLPRTKENYKAIQKKMLQGATDDVRR